MTQEQLDRCRYLNAEIEYLDEHIERLRAGLEFITQRYGKERVSSGSTHDRISAQIAQIEGMEDVLYDRRDKLSALQSDVWKWMDTLPATERQIVFLRVMDGMKWREVARDVNYDERWCKRLYTRALER